MTELVQPFVCFDELFLHIYCSRASTQAPSTYVSCLSPSCHPGTADKEGDSLSKFRHLERLNLPKVWTPACPDLSLVVMLCCPKHHCRHGACPVCAAVPVFVRSWFWRSLAFPLTLVFVSAAISRSSSSERSRSFRLAPPGFGATFAVF